MTLLDMAQKPASNLSALKFIKTYYKFFKNVNFLTWTWIRIWIRTSYSDPVNNCSDPQHCTGRRKLHGYFCMIVSISPYEDWTASYQIEQNAVLLRRLYWTVDKI